MSEVVSIKGKLKPVKLGSLTLEEKANSLIPDKDKNQIEYYDSALEYLAVEMNYYYDRTAGILYKIKAKELSDDAYITMKKNKNGNIEFQTSFYNGGTCLSEMLGDGLRDLK